MSDVKEIVGDWRTHLSARPRPDGTVAVQVRVDRYQVEDVYSPDSVRQFASSLLAAVGDAQSAVAGVRRLDVYRRIATGDLYYVYATWHKEFGSELYITCSPFGGAPAKFFKSGEFLEQFVREADPVVLGSLWSLRSDESLVQVVKTVVPPDLPLGSSPRVEWAAVGGGTRGSESWESFVQRFRPWGPTSGSVAGKDPSEGKLTDGVPLSPKPMTIWANPDEPQSVALVYQTDVERCRVEFTTWLRVPGARIDRYPGGMSVDQFLRTYQPAESSHWRSVEERDLIAAGFRTTDAAGCWRLDAGRISVVAVLGGPWKVALPGLGGQLLVVPQPQNAAWFWAMVYQLSDAAGPLSVPRPSNPDPDDHNATHR